MGFCLFLLYVALEYVRPFELYPELGSARVMLSVGLAALAVSIPRFLNRLDEHARTPQMYLMLGFASQHFRILASALLSFSWRCST
jgi:hypothetical protein